MSSASLNPIKGAGMPTKAGQPGYGSVPPSNPALLLEKLGARRSTPDSEALASSDDENDAHRQNPALQPAHSVKAQRSSSWLVEQSQPAISRPRKESFASNSMSPTASHPSTPSAESGAAAAWGSQSTGSVSAVSALMRGPPSSSFPWSGGIWNSERKDPPQRLSEVLPSPTTTSTHVKLSAAVASNGFFTTNDSESPVSQTSPPPQGQNPTSQIPFAIPLHPTPKTYRSQSYSVGQLDSDSPLALMVAQQAPPLAQARGRPGSHTGLQHRPSRPSMLSEMSSDGSMLGKVREDDGEDIANGSAVGVHHQSAGQKTIEMLTRENAMLRQANQHLTNTRLRPRASTGNAFGLGGNGYIQETVPEESDFAVDEDGDLGDGSDLGKRGLHRRMSEFGAAPQYRGYAMGNPKLEQVKKTAWQSSVAYTGVDGANGRRYSFADAPTRQPSISSQAGEPMITPLDLAPEVVHIPEFPTYPDNNAQITNAQVATYFYGGNNPAARQPQAMMAHQGQYQSPYPTYGMGQSTYNTRPTSPRHLFGITPPRQNQLLHIVLFKCSRADVFYIQEGTGLTVKPGDLVIVEADRGTDLGTVAKDNVDWKTAKELREHYAEEHYKWLMMYSQNAAAAQEGGGAGLMASSNGIQGSIAGGMGPAGQQHNHMAQEPGGGELKPKLIKRVAQQHEIQGLRDKEGQEAKAKRVCMQKVKEHGLNMEILDAEFQMDWKKLTFYYFADCYINFNSLVTDLFKIYKTRIWMSAINPASFATPTGTLAPSGVGPGAVGLGRGNGNADRRPNQAPAQDQQATYPGNAQVPRATQAFQHQQQTQPFAVPVLDRSGANGFQGVQQQQPGNYQFNPYHGYNAAQRGTPTNLQYPTNLVQQDIGPYSTAPFGPAGPIRFQNQAQGEHPTIAGAGNPNDWGIAQQFQGLSLNTR